MLDNRLRIRPEIEQIPAGRDAGSEVTPVLQRELSLESAAARLDSHHARSVRQPKAPHELALLRLLEAGDRPRRQKPQEGGSVVRRAVRKPHVYRAASPGLHRPVAILGFGLS